MSTAQEFNGRFRPRPHTGILSLESPTNAFVIHNLIGPDAQLFQPTPAAS
ncbi:MAG: hypothetical protein H6669_16035 [Ardenticatenaceae bacterium]|nr:hypothetical protein [Ardenticatenaceae bacterium]